MQNLSATHETAESAADVAELGLGPAVIAQLDPLHVSISGWKSLDAFTYDPTATQNVVRTHDTPDKAFEPTPAFELAVRACRHGIQRRQHPADAVEGVDDWLDVPEVRVADCDAELGPGARHGRER
jgi:hypothetical protein